MLYNKNIIRSKKNWRQRYINPGNFRLQQFSIFTTKATFPFCFLFWNATHCRNTLLSKCLCRSAPPHWTKESGIWSTDRWLRKRTSYISHSSWSGGSWIIKSNLLRWKKPLVHRRCWWLSAMITMGAGGLAVGWRASQAGWAEQEEHES